MVGVGTKGHALVTGASSGIGESLCRALAQEGYAVTACARREDLLKELVARLRSEGRTANHVVMDVSRSADVTRGLAEAESEFGPVDVVIANAGVGITAPARKLKAEWVDQMVDVNVKGAMYVVCAVLPGMLERRRGHIVGVTSLAGYRAIPGSAIYCATKAAFSTFLEGIRPEAAARGVVVTDVCPGFIRTPMTAKNKHPMPFMLEADDAAARILKAMHRGRAKYGFPWPMHAVSRLLQMLPVPIYNLLGRRVAATLEPRPKPAEGK